MDEKKTKGFFIYHDSRAILKRLSFEDVGRLTMAALDYSEKGTLPDFEYNVPLAMAFDVLKEKINVQKENYKNICERNKKNRNAHKAKLSPVVTSGHESNEIEIENEIETEIEKEKKRKFCPEPEINPAKSDFLLPLVDGSFYNVPADKIESWIAAYPSVDIQQEIKKMIVWLDANPTKKKTKQGICRFIINWLSKEQDKGRVAPAQSVDPEKIVLYSEMERKLLNDL